MRGAIDCSATDGCPSQPMFSMADWLVAGAMTEPGIIGVGGMAMPAGVLGS